MYLGVIVNRFKYEKASELPDEARRTAQKIIEPEIPAGFHRLEQEQYFCKPRGFIEAVEVEVSSGTHPAFPPTQP